MTCLVDKQVNNTLLYLLCRKWWENK